jgi:hypothetical protein
MAHVIRTVFGKSPDTGLRLIAIFKLVKGLLLAVVGTGALTLLHKDVSAVVGEWIDMLRWTQKTAISIACS